MDERFLLHNLLILIFIDQSHNDQALSYFKSNFQKSFEETPKIWYNYIRMFIYKSLYYKQCEYGFSKIDLVYFNILKYSIFFMRLKDASLESRGVFQGKRSLQIEYTLDFWTNLYFSFAA